MSESAPNSPAQPTLKEVKGGKLTQRSIDRLLDMMHPGQYPDPYEVIIQIIPLEGDRASARVFINKERFDSGAFYGNFPDLTFNSETGEYDFESHFRRVDSCNP